MQPLPESREALRQLAAFEGEGLEAGLQEVTTRLAEVVPGLVGLSLSVMEHGITVTYVASDPEAAALDGVQYVDGGPCVDAAQKGEPVEYCGEHPLSEGQWQLFAQAGAAAGVRSTLSLPIMDGARVTAGVNLYGAEPDTLEGRSEQLAELFGAWAPGVVANADLSFASRLEAAQAPARLQELETVDRAVGIRMARHGIEAQQARGRLQEAAARGRSTRRCRARTAHR